MNYPYSNLREVLNAARECSNGEVFIRVLIGYSLDNKFQEYATLEDLELITNLMEKMVEIVERNKD
jgi:hypothetical protein